MAIAKNSNVKTRIDWLIECVSFKKKHYKWLGRNAYKTNKSMVARELYWYRRIKAASASVHNIGLLSIASDDGSWNVRLNCIIQQPGVSALLFCVRLGDSCSLTSLWDTSELDCYTIRATSNLAIRFAYLGDTIVGSVCCIPGGPTILLK